MDLLDCNEVISNHRYHSMNIVVMLANTMENSVNRMVMSHHRNVMVKEAIEDLYMVMVTYCPVMMDNQVNKLVKNQLFPMLSMVRNHLVVQVSFVVRMMTNVMVLLITNQTKVFQHLVVVDYKLVVLRLSSYQVNYLELNSLVIPWLIHIS